MSVGGASEERRRASEERRRASASVGRRRASEERRGRQWSRRAGPRNDACCGLDSVLLGAKWPGTTVSAETAARPRRQTNEPEALPSHVADLLPGLRALRGCRPCSGKLSSQPLKTIGACRSPSVCALTLRRSCCNVSILSARLGTDYEATSRASSSDGSADAPAGATSHPMPVSAPRRACASSWATCMSPTSTWSTGSR